jgi:hypothetical protein
MEVLVMESSHGYLEYAGGGMWVCSTDKYEVLDVPSIMIGADVGKFLDPSSFSILSEPLFDYDKQAWGNVADYAPGLRDRLKVINHAYVERYKPPNPPIYCQQIERLPLFTLEDGIKVNITYEQIARRLASVIDKASQFGPVSLAQDRGGGGDAVIEHLERWGYSPIKVTISGQQNVIWHEDNFVSVPHRVLIGSLQAALQDRRIQFHPDLPGLETFRRELEQVEVIEDDSGSVKYKLLRSGGSHADTVISTALAWWLRQHLWSSSDTWAYDSQQRRMTLNPTELDELADLGNYGLMPGERPARANRRGRLAGR